MRIHLARSSGYVLTLLLLDCQAFSAETPNLLSAQEKAAGWRLLFDGKTTAGWRSFKKTTFPATGWTVDDGWLHCLGRHGGDIITDAEFDDFELMWDWKISPGGNSGLKYFVLETRNSAIGHEYQLIDDAQEPDAQAANGKRVTASFYDVLKPSLTPPVLPAGETNQSQIIVKGNYVEHWLNGKKVLAYTCGEPLKEAIAKSKFKNTSGFENKVRAHLLLQDHGHEIWFRNLKIRPLSPRK